LDCMDGKQARRTGSSSPLGQLLWVCLFIFIVVCACEGVMVLFSSIVTKPKPPLTSTTKSCTLSKTPSLATTT
jgi:phosphatidylglycerophosphate synthase